MEEVLPETLQRGKKLYEVGTEVLLRSLSPKTHYSPTLQDVPDPTSSASSQVVCSMLLRAAFTSS